MENIIKGIKLVKKDCSSGNTEYIYPITTVENIFFESNGEPLTKELEKYNHIYLPLKDNSRGETRLQIPKELRRKGLWITYIYCNNEIITEIYNGDSIDDTSWKNTENWINYFDKDIFIEEIKKEIKKYNNWYKG